MKKQLSLGIIFISLFGQAHVISEKPQTVLTDSAMAKAVGGRILSEDPELGVSVVYLTPRQMEQLSYLGHTQRKCAGFEVLDASAATRPQKVLRDLNFSQKRMTLNAPSLAPQITFNPKYKSIIDQASTAELKKTITWLSAYHTRHDLSYEPNKHVDDMVLKLKSWLKDAPWPYVIETISHKSTPQKSIRVKITGQKRPNETVIMGTHLDSVFVQPNPDPLKPGKIIPNAQAPGADDNASGSSNLIEALKLLKKVPNFDRSVEIYWYAAEERGLLGSADIAAGAFLSKKNIVGVLQLDMTLFPGSGEQVIGSVNDFTSPWLRALFIEINDAYVKSRIISTKCGYACSDHASWTRQGFHALMPFESSLSSINADIHSARDIINNKSNFNHSNTFTKYAILFALVLGNSNLRAP